MTQKQRVTVETGPFPRWIIGIIVLGAAGIIVIGSVLLAPSNVAIAGVQTFTQTQADVTPKPREYFQWDAERHTLVAPSDGAAFDICTEGRTNCVSIDRLQKWAYKLNSCSNPDGSPNLVADKAGTLLKCEQDYVIYWDGPGPAYLPVTMTGK